MMKQTFLILSLLVSLSSVSQNLLWAKSIYTQSELNANITVLDIAVDGGGNAFVTGYFGGLADFDPGPGSVILDGGQNDFDLFLAKYSSNGDYLWAFEIGSEMSEIGWAVTCDNSGNVYLCGSYGFEYDFDPGAGISSLPFSGSMDVFIAKYSGDGNYLWAKGINGIGLEEAYDIGLDDSGNIYITGTFEQTVDFDPGIETQSMTVVGAPTVSNIFFAKYDNSGNYIWAKKIETSSMVHMAIGGDGAVNMTGSYWGNVDFDPNGGIAMLNYTGNSECFVAKYDTNGDLVFAHGFGSLIHEGGNGVATDDAGNVYVSGYFSQTIDFDPGNGVAELSSAFDNAEFVAKYSSTGLYQWVFDLDVYSLHDVPGNALHIDNNNNLNITGLLGYTADFDPSDNEVSLECTLAGCIFLARYNADGDFISAFAMGGDSYNSFGRSVVTDDQNNIYLTGDFGGMVDFDPGVGTTTLTSLSDSGTDMFISKYSPGPVDVEGISVEQGRCEFYPNPANSSVSIKSDQTIVSVCMTDMYGRIVRSCNWSGNEMDVSALSTGQYLCTILTTNGLFVRKLIIE